ncbi:MAG: hypothetical protein AAF533_04810 [Acidobacteriota bacterium]
MARPAPLRSHCVRSLLLGLVVLAPTALAIQPAGDLTPADPAPGPPPFLIHQVDTAVSQAWMESDEAWKGLVEDLGGTWQARLDQRTGRPASIMGSGQPWLPGLGNDLTWEALGFQREPGAAKQLTVVETRARELLDRHPGLFDLAAAGADVVRDDERSVVLDDGRIVSLRLRVERDGLPVDDSWLEFRLSHGNLVQLASSHLSDNLAVAPTTVTFGQEEAHERFLTELAESLQVKRDELKIRLEHREPRLSLRPWAGPSGKGELGYRLTWRFGVRLQGEHPSWMGWVDAVTGAVFVLHDENTYQCSAPATPRGRVVGGVFVGPIEEVPEVVRGMPFARVVNGATVEADPNGSYDYTPGQPATTELDGRYFSMNCVGCTNPTNPNVTNPTSGTLDLGFGGADEVGNGFSTPADRNCFFHLQRVRLLAGKHLDGASTMGYVDLDIPSNVNIADSCNAFYTPGTPTVNFFRSNATCNNTGLIADVMQHEWGHGLDEHTGWAGDGARGEGVSDICGWLSTQDSALARYFFVGNGNGLREADEDIAGLITVSNIDMFCGGGPGPLGYGVHCEGQIISQTFWRMTRLLRQAAVDAGGTEAAGWQQAERLFFLSMPLSNTYLPDQPGSTYDAVVLVDDDDGDLTNGTPNGEWIDDAFLAHEIASTPQAGDSADCTPPASPMITLTPLEHPGSGLDQVQVTWTPVAGATEYAVYRNDDDTGAGADIPLATVLPPTTTVFDDNVLDGETYRYRVSVFTADGCFNIDENQEEITIGQRARFALDGWVIDDFEFGNANGQPDVGERFRIPLSVLNESGFDVTNVQVDLSSTTPGVNVLISGQTLGDMTADEVRMTAAPHLLVEIDAGFTCDDPLGLEVSVEATEGCWATDLGLTAGCAVPDPRPRLVYEDVIVGDSPAFGGSGNADGIVDPGEIIRLPVDLTNVGNRGATAVRGSMRLTGGPPGTRVGDPTDTWANIAVGATERTGLDTPPHFALVVPDDAPCGSIIGLELTVDYEGPTGVYQLTQIILFNVGQLVDVVLYQLGFEGAGDAGWIHGTDRGPDDWERGTPDGTGTDPNMAASGANCWGNDHGGNYPRNATNWLSSPGIDTTGATGVMLSYQRWLTVEDGVYDQARVIVESTEIWANPVGGGADHLLDDSWRLVEHDISAVADDNPSVTIIFELETDGGLQFGGWNVDDLTVFYREWQCSAVPPPATETLCDDGVDDDMDGAVDCDDPDCALSCPEADCFDGVDNDGDGRADCEDLDCADECVEMDCSDGVDEDMDGDTDCADDDCWLSCPEGECDDGIDNDADGDVDCADDDCWLSCPEGECDDGLDNDMDGAVDCDDSDCWLSCPEGECDDGMDNDMDGAVDCDDPDCALSCPEADCADGVDDDGDGATDCADPDCWLSCPEGECDDGMDNDGDGDVDCADEDCALSCPEDDCADGMDDDGDGAIDCADPDCWPVCPEGECDDGIDNDGDGDADCADADCAGSPSCEAGNCDDGVDNDGDGDDDCYDTDCLGDAACAELLAVNRQLVIGLGGLTPLLRDINEPGCTAAPRFTLCTNGPDDALVAGSLDAGIRLVDERLTPAGPRRLWLYQHSEPGSRLRVHKDGDDLIVIAD